MRSLTIARCPRSIFLVLYLCNRKKDALSKVTNVSKVDGNLESSTDAHVGRLGDDRSAPNALKAAHAVSEEINSDERIRHAKVDGICCVRAQNGVLVAILVACEAVEEDESEVARGVRGVDAWAVRRTADDLVIFAETLKKREADVAVRMRRVLSK